MLSQKMNNSNETKTNEYCNDVLVFDHRDWSFEQTENEPIEDFGLLYSLEE